MAHFGREGLATKTAGFSEFEQMIKAIPSPGCSKGPPEGVEELRNRATQSQVYSLNVKQQLGIWTEARKRPH